MAKCSLENARSIWNGLRPDERSSFFFIIQDIRSDLEDITRGITSEPDFSGIRFENHDKVTQKAIAKAFEQTGFGGC